MLFLLYGGLLHFCLPWPIQISYISFEIAPVAPINRQVRAITWRLWGFGVGVWDWGDFLPLAPPFTADLHFRLRCRGLGGSGGKNTKEANRSLASALPAFPLHVRAVGHLWHPPGIPLKDHLPPQNHLQNHPFLLPRRCHIAFMLEPSAECFAYCR